MQKLNVASLLLFLSVAALSILGLVMLYSTSGAIHGERLLIKQSIWIGLGVAGALLLYCLDYRRIGRFSGWLLLAVSLPLVYLALMHLLSRVGMPDAILSQFPLASKGATKGAYRWLYFGSFTVQPSEFAKLAIIIFLARYYGTDPRSVQSFKRGVWQPMLVVGSVLVAILLGGSLSVTMITGMVVLGLLFVAGVRLRYLALPLLTGALLFLIALLVSPERVSRITSYRNPEAFKADKGYQLYCSQLALGSGFWRGIGFNQSRMKQRYLPESHTDFILSIVGEELGFAATAGVMLLYMILISAALMISICAMDREGMLLAAGIGISIGLHAFIHLGVVSGFVPTTGITAPLISYGGSHMLVTWAGIGFLLNITRVRRITPDPQPESAQRKQCAGMTPGRGRRVLNHPFATR